MFGRPNNNTTVDFIAVFITTSQRHILTSVNVVILSSVVSLFGSTTNVINLIIFYRQGLNNTINMSFFAMAVSDLSGLILQLWYSFCVSRLLDSSGIPMVFSEVQYITGGVPREAFARITCLITVYVTIERCLCVAFPLHVKRMLTVKRTTIIILSIYLITWISGLPLYSTSFIGWKFYLARNTSLIGLVVTSNNHTVQGVVFIIHALFGIFTFTAVVIATVILTHTLGQKNTWRKRVQINYKDCETISNRDRATIVMVVLVACILIICYTPAVLLCVTTFCEPEFSRTGKYFNLYYSLWSFALLFENINSSVNMFLYLKMSTKYRQAFRQLFFPSEESSINQHNKQMDIYSVKVKLLL